MADFFGKLKQTIDKSAKVITAKSSSALDSQKIKSEISALKKSKNEQLFAIGKKVYESDKYTFNLDLVSTELNNVAGFDADIALKEAELERIKAETEEKLDQINKSFDNAAPSSAVEENDGEPEMDFENIDEPKDN
jgi:uncharacterized small protein (DUF1192 family)